MWGGGGGGGVWHNIDRHIIVISVDCMCSRCVVSCYVSVSSTGITSSAGRFLQFPWRGLRVADPCTRSETVLSQNCLTVGLSLRPPFER